MMSQTANINHCEEEYMPDLSTLFLAFLLWHYGREKFKEKNQ